MALDLNNPADREFLQKRKNPATGKTLLEEQIEYESKVADKIIVQSKEKLPRATARDTDLRDESKSNALRTNFDIILPEQVKNPMNKLEESYSNYLQQRLLGGEILEWRWSPINLRLASPKCWYKIDFMVVNYNRQLEFHETKGEKVWDDALVKFKVAAEYYPYFIFKWVTKNEDGSFEVKTLRGGKWSKSDK